MHHLKDRREHNVVSENRLAPKLFWRTTVLRTRNELASHIDEWLALERKCSDPYAFFQSYAWCESWLAAFGQDHKAGAEPLVCLIYQGNRLVAILPLMVNVSLGVRMLTILGYPHSQIANALVANNKDCAAQLRQCLNDAAITLCADVIDLSAIPDGSPLASALNADLLSVDEAEYISLVDFSGVGPVTADATNGWKSYEATLSKSRRKDINRKRNRFLKQGPSTFQRYDETSQEFRPLMEYALELKKDWLIRNGMVSVGLSYENIDEFLTGFAQTEGGFSVEMETLYLAKKPIALSFNLLGRGVRHTYLSAYDPLYTDLSPGTLLHVFSIQQALETGLSAYSFLGYPTSAKTSLMNAQIKLLRYRHPVTMRGHIWTRLWAKTLRPMAKRVLVGLRGAARVPLLGTILSCVLAVCLRPSK